MSDYAGRQDKGTYERLWANHEAKRALSEEQLELWQQLRSTHRIYLGLGKVLLVWKVVGGKPAPIRALSLESVNMQLASGISAEFLDSKTSERITVTHSPIGLLDLPVFMWVPYFSEVRWAPDNYLRLDALKKYCTFPVCVKTLGNPAVKLVEGDIHINTVAQFRASWPEYKNLEF